MNQILKYIFLLLVIVSCEEKTDWELYAPDIPLLVVEGMITNERKIHEIRLSSTVKSYNESPTGISGALVAITDQDNIYLLRPSDTEPGLYVTRTDLQAVFGKVYTLYIRYGGEEFTGSSFMIPVEPMSPHLIVPCEDNSEYYQLIVEENGSPFMMQVDLEWLEEGMEKSASVRYYHLNSIDVNEFFKPDKEVICFPRGTSIIRRKFSLSDDQQSFIRSQLMETEWRGGLFDVEQGNLKTNMSPNAVGYFSANTVVKDSIFWNP